MNESANGVVGGAASAPKMRAATFDDIKASLSAGLADYLRCPGYGLFFSGFYVASGLIILAILMKSGAPWMIIPLAIGFPLIAPFVAVGLYEVSRLCQAGEPVTWRRVMTEVFRQRQRQLGWMAFVVLFIFWIWVYQIRLLFAIFLGFKSFSTWESFAHIVATTPEGWGFLGVGTIVGTFLATVLFSSTVIAMPLLLDRDVDFVTALITSIGAVIRSPVPMLTYGAIIGVATFIGMLPFFLGLLVVMPVFGHATWHLYSRLSKPL